MSRFDTREAPPTGKSEALTSSHGEVQATSKSNTVTPTQRERVRRMLTRNWICGVDFISDPPDGYPPILRYTGRIHELRQEGWLIDRRPCAHPWHHHGKGVQMWQWRIVGHVDDGQLPFTSEGPR